MRFEAQFELIMGHYSVCLIQLQRGRAESYGMGFGTSLYKKDALFVRNYIPTRIYLFVPVPYLIAICIRHRDMITVYFLALHLYLIQEGKSYRYK